MDLQRSSLGALVLLSILACDGRPNNENAAAGETFHSFSEDGAWCWFSDPRAIYFEGRYRRTYSGWVDSVGSIVVGFYDHGAKRIETNIVHKGLEKDDHDNPALLVDRNGLLTIFYSRHAGREPIYTRRARTAEEVSDWEPVRELPLNDSSLYAGLSNTYTYANVCRLRDENDKLFLFWRGADFKPNVSASADGGTTWSSGRILILPDRVYPNRRPYVKVATDNSRVIHLAFTDGHPHVEPANSIYYAKYEAEAFYRAGGALITNWESIPFQPEQADKVYDASTSGEKAWVWDVAELQNGNPVIVYSRFPNDSTHLYCYAAWSNDRWNNYELVNSGRWFPQTPAGTIEREPNYSGGLALDHSDPSRVYLSRVKNGKFEIEKWFTPDEGKTWDSVSITRNSQFDNVRPVVIRNHNRNESPTLLWMNVQRYVHYTDYRAAIKMH